MINGKIPAWIAVGCIWAGLSAAEPARGCTAFILRHPDRVVMGEGFDWYTGDGHITITPKGMAQESVEAILRDRPPLKWTTRFGSVGFGWTAIGMPTCGMNTEGLAVTGLLFSQGRLPEIGDAPVIGISQWKQYILDTCATVSEALATLDHMRLATLSAYRIHYLLVDRSGDAAVIQFVDGNRRIYRGHTLPIPVLTNDQRMDRVMAETVARDPSENGLKETGSVRFGLAASLVRQAAADAPEQMDAWADRIFDSVRLDGFTRWNIVFDTTRQRIWIRTDTHPQRRAIDLRTIDFNCSAGLRAARIQAGPPGGPIVFSRDLAASGYEQRLTALNRSIGLSHEKLAIMQDYPRDRPCSAQPLPPNP